MKKEETVEEYGLTNEFETFEQEYNVEAHQKQRTDINNKESFSAGIRKMLQQPATDDMLPVKTEIAYSDLPQFDSIFEVARANNMTLQEYVAKDPQYALRLAENSYASWQNLLTTAAITGGIDIPDEDGVVTNYTLTKNQTRLIEVRVAEARKQYELVDELTVACYNSEDQRKDALEKAMFRRALKGDTKLAVYLHDRVDGRPAETKQVEYDYDNAYNIYAIIKTLFDKQLEVLNSGNGVKLICCSRRAGKTHLLVALMLIECLRKPRTTVMYIGETMELSEALVDKAAQDIVDICQLKNKRGMRFDWKHIDNGSNIIIRGLSNTKDPDQIRGKAAKVIVIDEFFHLKSELLEYMQREVLEPMQMDYADDYMFVCAGTPPRIKGTYGEKVWKTWDVPHFQWTWRDNPHPVDVKLREEFVNKQLADKGLDWSSSFARREYNGEWAYDDDLLLYPEFYTYNKRDTLPSIKPTRILFGIDYGVGDNDTIWGAIWNDDEHRGYQFWEDEFNRLDILDRSISQLEYLGEQVKAAWRTALDMFPDLTPKEANKRILWDADDNDQHLTDYFNINLRLKGEEYEELRLNIMNAHKTDRTIMYDQIRDLLRRGDMLIISGGKCEQEMLSTILKRGPNGEVYSEVDSKAYHPDLLPAMRYALWNAIGV